MKPRWPELDDPAPRLVRVFVSSTFRDMHEERDELVKRTFPELRRRCEERGVTLAEIDLRWGVTDEEVAEQRVLSRCFAEIDACRPYFIGILGDRYGWVPDSIPPEVARLHAWLDRYPGRSVTELEFRYGVLDRADQPQRAFFYIREEARAAPPAPGAIARTDGPDAAQLAALKHEVWSSGLPVRRYGDAAEIGEQVLRDFDALLGALFPPRTELDGRAREDAAHRAFAARLLVSHLDRPKDLARLDSHVGGGGPPLAVVGDAGMGKSALLASWLFRHLRGPRLGALTASSRLQRMAGRLVPSLAAPGHGGDPEPKVAHFVGATPASTSLPGTLQRLMAELKRLFALPLPVPEEPEAIREGFASWLHLVPPHRRCVIVLDGVDGLEERDGGRELGWLPAVIPEQIRFVISARRGPTADLWRERGWPVMELHPMTPDELRSLLERCLEPYGRRLEAAMLQKLTSSAPCRNPLHARTIADELRVSAVHETLRASVDGYLTAADVGELYAMVLARCERDYDRERAGMVRDATSLLWGARRGLSEVELREMLGVDGAPLPAGVWSPLHLALRASLIDDAGVLRLSREELRDAVRRRYLARGVTAVHERLAEYFARRPTSPRAVDELPWQLAESGAWPRLAALLADPAFLGLAWRADALDVLRLSATMAERSTFGPEEVHGAALGDPLASVSHASIVARIMRHQGRYLDAERIHRALAGEARQRGDRAALAVQLGELAAALRSRGSLQEALASLEEQGRLLGELGDAVGVAASVGNQAAVCGDLDRFEQASALYATEQQLWARLGDRGALARSLFNHAWILEETGDVGCALEQVEQYVAICRERHDVARLAAGLGAQGILERKRGRLRRAQRLHQEEERICRDARDRDGLQASLVHQASLAMEAADFDRAAALLEEQEAIAKALGRPAAIVASLESWAVLNWNLAQREAARRNARDALALAAKHGLRRQERGLRRLLERFGAASG